MFSDGEVRNDFIFIVGFPRNVTFLNALEDY